MSEPALQVEQIRREALVLSEAYRLRLVGRLWWTNLLLVVLPAAMATAAAYFAGGMSPDNYKGLVTGILAGGAAVLIAVHKALKCEEYQAECQRLSQEYRTIEIKAKSLLSKSVSGESLVELSQSFKDLTNSVKAQLPNSYIAEAGNWARMSNYEPIALSWRRF